MPRLGPKRPNIAVRLGLPETAALDKLATAEGVTRSDIIRRAIRAYLAKWST